MTGNATPSVHPRRVLIAGYYASGSGYPNGRVTQERLERAGVPVVDLGFSMPAAMRLWKTARGSFVARSRGACLLLTFNLMSAVRVLTEAEKTDRVYVRYPGIPFMLFMSFIPRRWRPRCQLEAFISIWDAAFVDRSGAGRMRYVSRLILALERRAMRAAHTVIVDTDANGRFIEQCLGVDPARVVAIPLGVDETAWERAAPKDKSGFTVLFAGTFVPLHGIDVITSAIGLIGSAHGIRFIFIGDGQDAPLLQSFIDSRPEIDIQWRREWLSPEELAAYASAADICLGVFGGPGKASRVLPYKLYMYLCLGKAFITQAQLSTPGGVPLPPAEYVPGRSAAGLAEAILRLHSSDETRLRREKESRAFYERYLSNAELDQAWASLLRRND